MAFDPSITPVDYILLQGLQSPGTARVVDAAGRGKVDVRGAYGISATVVVWREIAEFKVVIELRTSEDWEQWEVWAAATVLREMRPNNPGPASKQALDIWHPWLEMLDIKSVIVKSVGQPTPIDDGTVFAITIEFVEFRAAKFTLSKPEGSRAREEDGVGRLMDRLSDKIRGLNQELAKD